MRYLIHDVNDIAFHSTTTTAVIANKSHISQEQSSGCQALDPPFTHWYRVIVLNGVDELIAQFGPRCDMQLPYQTAAVVTAAVFARSLDGGRLRHF
jgi:hypothetical protein